MLKRLALPLALLLAAPMAAQIYHDPCVGLNRYSAYGTTWWQWSWYNLHLTNLAHIEFVPYGGGIGLLCMYAGGHRSNAGWLPRFGYYPFGGQLPGCNAPREHVTVDAIWWQDASPQVGDRLAMCSVTGIADLFARRSGFSLSPMQADGCLTGLGQHDLVVVRAGEPLSDWYRWPTYWAVLLRPGRGYW